MHSLKFSNKQALHLIVLFVFLLATTNNSKAQNLVPNPSFETLSTCVSGGISLATPWTWPSTHTGSVDIFHTCVSTNCSVSASVPNNFFGIAPPHHGNGYAGLITSNLNNGDYREYMQVKLTSPLVANTNYCISFRTLRATRCDFATNNLGLHISTNPITQAGNGTMTNFVPQVECTQVITDSLNWTLISGSYTASGGEEYITIGNFRTDAFTTMVNAGAAAFHPCQPGTLSTFAYYFIDSVQVEMCTIPTSPPTAIFSASDTTICEGSCINFTDSSNGNPVSWLWNFPGANTTSSTLQNPSSICYPSSGVFIASLIVTNSSSESDTAYKTIYVNAPKQFTQNIKICSGNSFLLPGGTIVTNTGIYMDTLLSVAGCDSIVTTNLLIDPLPVVSFTANDTFGCGTLCTNFTNQSLNYYSQSWDFGNCQTSIAANPYICFSSTGNYTITLTITDNNGCTNFLTKNGFIHIANKPVADFIATPHNTTLTNSTIHFYDQSTNAFLWQWNFGDPAQGSSGNINPSYTYDDTGSYPVTLIVANAQGCSDTIIKYISVLSEFMCYVPNAFSPNNDAINDIFLPRISGIRYDAYELSIYDRWGNEIFKSTDPQKGWDGKTRSSFEIAQIDVYVWKINCIDLHGNQRSFVGDVSLIK